MNEEERAALLEEVLALSDVTRRTPSGIDSYEAAERWLISHTAAINRLRFAERAKQLTSQMEYDPERGRQVRVWRVHPEYLARHPLTE